MFSHQSMDEVLGDQYPTLSKAGETDVGAILWIVLLLLPDVYRFFGVCVYSKGRGEICKWQGVGVLCKSGDEWKGRSKRERERSKEKEKQNNSSQTLQVCVCHF